MSAQLWIKLCSYWRQTQFPRAQVSSAIFLDPLCLTMEQEIDKASPSDSGSNALSPSPSELSNFFRSPVSDDGTRDQSCITFWFMIKHPIQTQNHLMMFWKFSHNKILTWTDLLYQNLDYTQILSNSSLDFLKYMASNHSWHYLGHPRNASSKPHYLDPSPYPPTWVWTCTLAYPHLSHYFSNVRQNLYLLYHYLYLFLTFPWNTSPFKVKRNDHKILILI